MTSGGADRSVKAAGTHRRIYIVSHTFPPAPGIGGRRWAKFGKYLKRAGVRVHVLRAAHRAEGSPWTEDVEGISQSTYAHAFPGVLDTAPTSLSGKIRYRLALLRNKLRSEGTPYDRALFDEKTFLSALRKGLERDRPDTLIVSAAPFLLLRYALKVRADFPDIRFVADLRDPWTSGSTYGYRTLRRKRKKFEARAEAEAVHGFDLVLTPWASLAEELAAKYPDVAGRIKVLRHCYDPEEITPREVISSRRVPLLYYGGNLYSGEEKIWKVLSRAARSEKMEVVLRSARIPKLISALTHAHFRTERPVSSRTFFAEAARADWLLYPVPPALRNGNPTKLPEFTATGVPLLAFGAAGALSEAVVRHGAGLWVDEATDAESLLRIVTSPPRLNPDTAFVKSFEAPAVTRELLEITDI